MGPPSRPQGPELAPPSPRLLVYEGADAFPGKDAYIVTVKAPRTRKECVRVGAKICDYLDFGGFCIEPNDQAYILYFRHQDAGAIEAARLRAPGCTLVAVRWRGAPPPPEDPLVVVPMGHYCLTAGFLRQTRRRRQALPLDWCRATFDVWHHMLHDDFKTLLQPPPPAGVGGGETREHPYNTMFEDVNMFLHQGGWGNEEVRRRVARLRYVLARGGAFGLAIYFEGPSNVSASLEALVDGARRVADLESGFLHIVLIYFSSAPSSPATGEWSTAGTRVSVLHYWPSRETSYWDGLLAPEDTIALAEELEERFPQVFPTVATRGPEEPDVVSRTPPSSDPPESEAGALDFVEDLD